MANNLLYALTRAATRVIAKRSHEEEIEAMNRGRLPNLPMVGNTDTLGGIKMGSLTKLAEETQRQNTLCAADHIKIACAHLTNYLAVAGENGRQVKTASAGTINQDMLVKCARLYVVDEFDLYKEAAIDPKQVWQALANAAAKVKSAVGTGAKAVGTAGKATGDWFGRAGKAVGGAGKATGSFIGDAAKKKGVQIGAAATGAAAGGYGLNELLRSKGIIGEES